MTANLKMARFMYWLGKNGRTYFVMDFISAFRRVTMIGRICDEASGVGVGESVNNVNIIDYRFQFFFGNQIRAIPWDVARKSQTRRRLG